MSRVLAARRVISEMTDTSERLSICKISHTFLRLLALVNIGLWTIDITSPRYGHALANASMRSFVVGWLFASSIALPLYTGIEVLLMWSSYEETRALLIDGILALGWFLFFWIRVLYGFTHSVLF
jgi:hypothetical protein